MDPNIRVDFFWPWSLEKWLGILGPVKNMASDNHTIHPHGFRHTKESKGLSGSEQGFVVTQSCLGQRGRVFGRSRVRNIPRLPPSSISLRLMCSYSTRRSRSLGSFITGLDTSLRCSQNSWRLLWLGGSIDRLPSRWGWEAYFGSSGTSRVQHDRRGLDTVPHLWWQPVVLYRWKHSEQDQHHWERASGQSRKPGVLGDWLDTYHRRMDFANLFGLNLACWHVVCVSRVLDNMCKDWQEFQEALGNVVNVHTHHCLGSSPLWAQQRVDVVSTSQHTTCATYLIVWTGQRPSSADKVVDYGCR